MKKVKLLLPPIPRYTIKYSYEDGTTRDHEVSQPIEKKKDSITVYSFTSHGIRTFKLAKIVDIS